MAEVPLKSLERYDVLDRIAVGGMAEVFLAKAYGAHGFEKTLAIKRILPELTRDPEFEERFIAEAKLAVKLSHTNVVQVFDFGRFAGSLFIAMEFVDGLDLAALLRRHKEAGRHIPVPAAFHIAVELARGLDFAHQHGVVHRDVSPSNILLSKAGEVKIADFGIAVAARPEKVVQQGGKRKVMGKWRYMSPEQARGESLGPSSDIFSMAVVMYELLTGEKLFPGDEVEDIVRNINEMQLPRPSEIRPDLPKRVDDILMPALSREPSKRPPRAAVLQRAFTELSYESSIVATALDVADAVTGALEMNPATTSGRHSLDSIVRAQVAENLGKGDGNTGRRTALTTDQRSTAITASKLYRDRGQPLVITREAIILGTQTTLPGPDEVNALDDAAGGDGEGEEGDRGRITEPVQLQQLGDDTTSRALLERRVDPDGITHLELEHTHAAVPSAKRTGKVTGPFPEIPDAPAAAPVATPATPRRVWLFALLLAIVAGGSIAVWAATRPDRTGAGGGDDPTAGAVDAATAAAVATLVVESDPPGATGRAGDVAIPATPTTIEVPAGVTLTVSLQLTGYRTWTDDGVRGEPGEKLRINATLQPLRAELHVTTTPDGATVTLGGKLVGETPLDLDDLDPARGVDLVIARAGYETVRQRVDLELERPVTVHRDLVEVVRLGSVRIYIEEGWGDIYLHGKKLGRAPTSKPIKLPVGHHHLRLVNPPSGKELFLDVDVVEGQNRDYRAKFQ